MKKREEEKKKLFATKANGMNKIISLIRNDDRRKKQPQNCWMIEAK